MADRIKQINVSTSRDDITGVQYGIQSECTDKLSIKTSIFGGLLGDDGFDGSEDYMGKVANNGQLISTGYVYSLGRRIDSYYVIELGGKIKECNTISSMSSDTTLTGLQTKTEFTPEKKTGNSITCKLIPGCKYNLVLNYGYPEFKVNIDDLKDKLYNGQEILIVFDNHTDKESTLKWDYDTTVSNYVLMGGIEDGELTIPTQRYETMSIMLLNGTYFVCCGGGGGSIPIVENNGSLTFEFDIDHFYTYTEQKVYKEYKVVFSPTPGTVVKMIVGDTYTISAKLKCDTDTSINRDIPMNFFRTTTNGVGLSSSGVNGTITMLSSGTGKSIKLEYDWSTLFSNLGITDGSNTGTGSVTYNFNVVTQKQYLNEEIEWGDIYFFSSREQSISPSMMKLGKCYHNATSIPEGGEIILYNLDHESNDKVKAFYINVEGRLKSGYSGNKYLSRDDITMNLNDFFDALRPSTIVAPIRTLKPIGIYLANQGNGGEGRYILSDNSINNLKEMSLFSTSTTGGWFVASFKFGLEYDETVCDMGHKQRIWELFGSNSASTMNKDGNAVITVKTTDGSGDSVTYNETYTYKVKQPMDGSSIN